MTGAAGSLGEPLAHVLATLPLAELTLVDVHEPSLFGLRQALGERAGDQSSGAARVRYVLADIRRAARVESLLADLGPQVIFHLAACKHVPWAEDDPVEFVATNVLGHVPPGPRRRPAAGRADRVPLYGQSDCAAEPLRSDQAHCRGNAACRRRPAGRPSVTICRFVNVLGSRGAASETFVRLIGENRPLPITDARMRRYWISPRHALALLLHAALLAGPSLMVVPDVTDELTPVDIATRLWRQLRSGEAGPPFVDAGARPGERLSEPLLQAEERLAPPAVPGLRQVSTPAARRQDRALYGVGAPVC